MSVKVINVSVGNNLNAIVKDGKNVDAGVIFSPEDVLPFSTPSIKGGHGYGPFKLEYNSQHLGLIISVGANTLGDAKTEIKIPVNANELSVNLEGSYNGKIDIQTSFK